MNLPIKTFIILWLSHFSMDFCIGIWPLYKTLSGIDLALAGLIVAIAGFTGEFSQIFFGYFSDKGHRKKILLLGLCLASLMLWITFFSDFSSLLALMLLVMIGSGSFHSSAVGLASKFFKNYKGRAILLFTTGGVLGYGISQITFTKFIGWFNGHSAILFIPCALFIAYVFFHRFPEIPTDRKKLSLKELVAPFKNHRKSLSLLYFTQVLSCGVFNTFVFILPDILIEKASASWLTMGGGHLFFVFGSVVATASVGMFCHKWGFKATLLGTLGISIFSFLCFLLIPFESTWATLLTLTILGSALYTVNPVITSWGNHLVPESPSTVSALLMGMAWCVANLFPALAGFLKPFFLNSPILSVMLFFSLFLLVSLLLAFLIPQEEFSEVLDKENELLS